MPTLETVKTREEVVLDWLRMGPGTVDQFIVETGEYVNSFAPVFTGLLKAGKIKAVGQRRTSHGGIANVWAVVE